MSSAVRSGAWSVRIPSWPVLLGKIISSENRSFLIKNLARLNFEEIEVGSLVNPKVIPTMENSLEVYNYTLNPNNYKSYLLVGNKYH